MARNVGAVKSTQKGLPAPDSDASYNCGFSKGKWPSAFHHDGAAYRRHPWRQSANANIVFALPLQLNHFPRKSHSLRRIYARGSSPFLLGYENHPDYLGRAFENTCAEIKNKNLVCAKNQEIHANNSKTRIRYVQKSRKHMQTAPPNCGLLFFEKLHGSIEDKFPCRYFWGRVKNKN